MRTLTKVNTGHVSNHVLTRSYAQVFDVLNPFVLRCGFKRYSNISCLPEDRYANQNLQQNLTR